MLPSGQGGLMCLLEAAQTLFSLHVCTEAEASKAAFKDEGRCRVLTWHLVG